MPCTVALAFNELKDRFPAFVLTAVSLPSDTVISPVVATSVDTFIVEPTATVFPVIVENDRIFVDIVFVFKLDAVKLDAVIFEPNKVDAVKLDAVIFEPNSVDAVKLDAVMFEVNMVDAMKLDAVMIEVNMVDAIKLDAVVFEVNMVDAIIVDAVIVEFTVRVDILIAFPTIVENLIIPVEIPFVNRDDVVVVDTLIDCTLIVVPDIVKNAMFVAVNWPLVFEVNVLIVDPVAVEKNRFCATRLFATYMS